MYWVVFMTYIFKFANLDYCTYVCRVAITKNLCVKGYVKTYTMNVYWCTCRYPSANSSHCCWNSSPSLWEWWIVRKYYQYLFTDYKYFMCTFSCWISTDDGAIWAFVGPMLLIVLVIIWLASYISYCLPLQVNIIILFMVLLILFNSKSQKLTSDVAKQMDVVKLVART